MNRSSREIRSFFFSEYFSDGLRITLGVLLPALLWAYLDQFEKGITISLGALCVSITDIPGPVRHKRNGMLVTNLIIFLVALLTGYARFLPWALGAEILVLSFFFSMFTIYGNRATFIGTAGLLVMILLLDQEQTWQQVPVHAGLILAGGLWYTSLSLSFFYIRPYRPTQQALGECILEVAKFLRLKADFYRAETDLEADYHQLVSQQIVVSAKQDAVRELLFKGQDLGKQTTSTGRVLTLTFVDVVDLYERTTAIHYDYAALREKFGENGILTDIAQAIDRLADVLDNLGFAIQANLTFKSSVPLDTEFEELRTKIRALDGSNTLVLRKILINLRTLNQRMQALLTYFQPGSRVGGTGHLEASRFVTHQDYSLKRFRDNLTLESGIFRHALRVGIVSLVGFGVARTLAYGEHSYWVLLTIIVILKPGFSISKQRTYQRIIGTLVGGAIGIAILAWVPDPKVLFWFLLVFMVGTYSFQRLNYVTSVIFMTPFILILFHFMGMGGDQVIRERVVDTLIGAGIAFSASYWLFPSWESDQLKGFVQSLLQANLHYLQKLADLLTGRTVPDPEYKLARKEVYVSAANLSAAFQRMVSEPKTKQRYRREIHKFLVLNHLLSSFIASVAAGVLAREDTRQRPGSLRSLRRALVSLQDSLRKLDPAYPEIRPDSLPADLTGTEIPALSPDDRLLQEQLGFIRQVSSDLAKIIDDMPGFQPAAAPPSEKKLNPDH